jgi:mRNA interferase YafQ
MLTPVFTGQFKRDLKKSEKRGLDIEKIKEIISLLLAEEPLLPRHGDHPLAGNWKGHRELHVEPDWLLIYKVVGSTLRLERTGTHADLFD